MAGPAWRGGGGAKAFRLQSKFRRHTVMYTGNAEENLPGSPGQPGGMAKKERAFRLFPHGGKFAGTSRPCSGRAPPRSKRRLVWMREPQGSAAMGNIILSLGPPSTMESGPRRTRRLRLMPQKGMRPGRIPVPQNMPAEICRRRTEKRSSPRRRPVGRRSNLYTALRTLCHFQRENSLLRRERPAAFPPC